MHNFQHANPLLAIINRSTVAPHLQNQVPGLASRCTDPIPEHLIESFTVDNIPAQAPAFEPEPEDLCCYCLTMAQILNSHNFSAMEEKVLTGLLFELTSHFADELTTPRFVRTAITV